MTDPTASSGSAADDTLRTQREKFDQYRSWMKQQQQTLETTGAATAEMARRLDGGAAAGGGVSRNAHDIAAQESAYARRHRRGGSPQNGNGPASPTGGGATGGMAASARSIGGANSGRAGSPPSPYNKFGQVIYSSPPGAERPPWINTKVGSTNMKSQIPNEQLAKFMPPPPPSDDHSGYVDDALNVYSRSQLWQRRKHQKLHEARAIKEMIIDNDCTFTPQTHTKEFFSQERGASTTSARERSELNQQQGASLSATAMADSAKYGGGFTVTGVEDFLARQQRARDDQTFRDQRLKTRPQFAWKNTTTTTEPFELGRKRQDRIRSLKQPFTAAPGAVQQAMRNIYAVPVNNVFQPLEGILPRGVFSGVTAAEIVDSAVLRTGAASQSPAASRH